LQIRITAILYLLGELTSHVGVVEDLVRIRIKISEAKTLQIRITATLYLLGELTSLVGAVKSLGNPDPDQRSQNVADLDHGYNIPAWRADKSYRGC
jgi:hypothetical protein